MPISASTYHIIYIAPPGFRPKRPHLILYVFITPFTQAGRYMDGFTTSNYRFHEFLYIWAEAIEVHADAANEHLYGDARILSEGRSRPRRWCRRRHQVSLRGFDICLPSLLWHAYRRREWNISPPPDGYCLDEFHCTFTLTDINASLFLPMAMLPLHALRLSCWQIERAAWFIATNFTLPEAHYSPRQNSIPHGPIGCGFDCFDFKMGTGGIFQEADFKHLPPSASRARRIGLGIKIISASVTATQSSYASSCAVSHADSDLDI